MVDSSKVISTKERRSSALETRPGFTNDADANGERLDPRPKQRPRPYSGYARTRMLEKLLLSREIGRGSLLLRAAAPPPPPYMYLCTLVIMTKHFKALSSLLIEFNRLTK